MDSALGDYLRRLPTVAGDPAMLALTPLAYAQAPGLPLDLWQLVMRALGGRASAAELSAFATSAAANFLTETGTHETTRTYRLFHQALNDALLRGRGDRQETDQRTLTATLIAKGRSRDWAGADPYLLRCLPEHAHRAGMLDDLLTDDGYLTHADLLRLLAVADSAAIHATAAERSAMLSVTAMVENTDPPFTVKADAPYQGHWSALSGWLRPKERMVLEGHRTRQSGLPGQSPGSEAVGQWFRRSHYTSLGSRYRESGACPVGPYQCRAGAEPYPVAAHHRGDSGRPAGQRW